jgi:thiol-disulfide isomerase/thioredoxin
LIVLGTTLVLATVVGLVYRSLDGRLRASSPVSERSPVVEHLGAAGLEPGERATLVQFSSAFCAPCRTTRGLLADVAETVPGVRHVEFDVSAGEPVLDLVRSLDIRRTPTTIVLDAHGREVRRASGVPQRAQVLAALQDATGEADRIRPHR